MRKEMGLKRFAPGTCIFYTGDRVNQPSAGTVTRHHERGQHSPESVDILYDVERFEGDTRESRMTPVRSFSHGPGRRFWLLADWREERDRWIEELRASSACR